MRTFIIAEAGVNHNGREDLALALVDAAANAGADAIKFQTFSADKVVQKTAPKAQYQASATGGGSQYDMLKRLELSDQLHDRLIAHCDALGIEFMSTPFDKDAADLLVSKNVKRLKIPSGEITNHPFLRHLAGNDVKLILSTGMATLDEIQAAVEVIAKERAERGFTAPLDGVLTILHCTSNYPTEMENVNLRAMNTIGEATGMPIGYSDHTLGIAVCTAAVALGARVLEKHFTLDRSMEGPDHAASLEPDELATLVQQVRDTEQALGSPVKAPTASESEMRILARRSITAAVDLAVGDVLTEAHLDILRPAIGIQPQDFEAVIGRTVTKAVEKGTALQWHDLDDGAE